jgi:hypothetical protein
VVVAVVLAVAVEAVVTSVARMDTLLGSVPVMEVVAVDKKVSRQLIWVTLKIKWFYEYFS